MNSDCNGNYARFTIFIRIDEKYGQTFMVRSAQSARIFGDGERESDKGNEKSKYVYEMSEGRRADRRMDGPLYFGIFILELTCDAHKFAEQISLLIVVFNLRTIKCMRLIAERI